MADPLMEHRELRSSLQTLSEHSLKASRRLDDTYYSILEKVSLLRQNIVNLQELSKLTKELHETFQLDTHKLAEDVVGQIDDFSNFVPQEEQLENLESRIRAGKKKATALNAKLMDARKRVEARAKIEAEWEAKSTSMHYSTKFLSLSQDTANIPCRTPQGSFWSPEHLGRTHRGCNVDTAVQAHPVDIRCQSVPCCRC